MSGKRTRIDLEECPWCGPEGELDEYRGQTICLECGATTKADWNLRPEVKKLKKKLEDAEKELKELKEKSYEEYFDLFLRRRNINTKYGDVPCHECQGIGVVLYGSTSTWRGGQGGNNPTKDVCNVCWGSGNAKKPWPNRKLQAEQMEKD